MIKAKVKINLPPLLAHHDAALRMARSLFDGLGTISPRLDLLRVSLSILARRTHFGASETSQAFRDAMAPSDETEVEFASSESDVNVTQSRANQSRLMTTSAIAAAAAASPPVRTNTSVPAAPTAPISTPTPPPAAVPASAGSPRHEPEQAVTDATARPEPGSSMPAPIPRNSRRRWSTDVQCSCDCGIPGHHHDHHFGASTSAPSPPPPPPPPSPPSTPTPAPAAPAKEALKGKSLAYRSRMEMRMSSSKTPEEALQTTTGVFKAAERIHVRFADEVAIETSLASSSDVGKGEPTTAAATTFAELIEEVEETWSVDNNCPSSPRPTTTTAAAATTTPAVATALETSITTQDANTTTTRVDANSINPTTLFPNANHPLQTQLVELTPTPYPHPHPSRPLSLHSYSNSATSNATTTRTVLELPERQAPHARVLLLPTVFPDSRRKEEGPFVLGLPPASVLAGPVSGPEGKQHSRGEGRGAGEQRDGTNNATRGLLRAIRVPEYTPSYSVSTEPSPMSGPPVLRWDLKPWNLERALEVLHPAV
ncbi:MAG: hypothetical protein M1819_007432 [Sarea resinae]|nr:MAG: hypothetical protein M1819_007432 [Sarea resinae]